MVCRPGMQPVPGLQPVSTKNTVPIQLDCHSLGIVGCRTSKDLLPNFIRDFEGSLWSEINADERIFELLQLIICLIDVPVGQQLLHHGQLLPCFLRTLEHAFKVPAGLLLQDLPEFRERSRSRLNLALYEAG